MVQDENVIPSVEEQNASIIDSASQINVQGLRDMNADDVNELFRHESLSEGDLIQLSEQPSNIDLSCTSIDNDTENEPSPNINLNGIEKIIELCKQL